MPRKRQHPGATLVYRVVPHNGGVVFATRERAEHVARIHNAMQESTTWAGFRKAMPRKEYSWVVQQGFDDMGEPRPRGSAPFSAEQVPGFSDGDYPPWLQQEMEAVLPPELLERFGELKLTFVNGDYWHIPPANLQAMLDALKALGYHLEDGRELRFW